MERKNLEDRYADLILKKCVNFNKSKSLVISYMELNADFARLLADKARKMGVNDILLYDEKIYEKHDLLKKLSIEEIENHPIFSKQIWDEYALKNASFITIETEIPDLMDDIEPEKLAKVSLVDKTTRPIQKKLQLSFQIPWCFFVMPNKIWAKKIYPNLNDEDAYDTMFKTICCMCMVDTECPEFSWNDFLTFQENKVSMLNQLEVTKMHYTNSLGSNLTVELPKNVIWASAGELGDDMLVNMPSYEIFTTPDFRKTNGIIYSSKPLIYNGGLVDKFYLKFQNGKVVDYNAEVGKDILKNIIESDKYSYYLGEVALVNYNSPISDTGLVFGNTLLDENASCHLALGNGFPECIKDGYNMSDEKLLEAGVNISKNHIDFMIGTEDLNIEAETKKGKILIFEKGNFKI